MGEKRKYLEPLTGLRGIFIVGIFCLLIFILLANVVGFEMFSGDIRLVFTFLICPIIIWVSIQVPWIERILTIKPLLGVGKISMSLYYWHIPMITLVNMLYWKKVFLYGFSGGIRFIVYLIVLIFWSVVSYWLIERGKIEKCLLGMKRRHSH